MVNWNVEMQFSFKRTVPLLEGKFLSPSSMGKPLKKEKTTFMTDNGKTTSLMDMEPRQMVIFIIKVSLLMD